MLGYPYINELFLAVLKESKVIQGNYFGSSRRGEEINAIEMGEHVVLNVNKPKLTFPCALLLPPTSSGNYAIGTTLDTYRFQMMFLAVSFTGKNGEIKNPSPVMNTKSQHTIIQDWHDMKRCAKDFIQALNTVLSMQDVPRFQIIGNVQQIEPVTLIGNNGYSGAILEFQGVIADSCNMEDYDDAAINRIIVPTIDSHPLHT